MTIIFFDDHARQSLLPLTYTRPVANLRVGILTIAEKWSKTLKASFSYKTVDYLQAKFPLELSMDNLYINGSICPDEALLQAVANINEGDMLIKDGLVIAVRVPGHFNPAQTADFRPIHHAHDFIRINFPEDIFKHNAVELKKDFDLITKGRRSSHSLNSTNTIIGNDIFVEEGAEAECATFNTKQGPIYLGKNTEVWEGTHIRGSFALCDHSQVKMGAKIYPGTTIGPYCRVGGEINNTVIWGYSSKGHEGYLGNAVIGEWCNIGADTNNSNLKNNYAEVRLWDYEKESFRKTGLQFCGIIMADHAKCGINTMFNTGTVVGVSANVFGDGFPRNFIPDFAWGGAHGFDVYALKKMFETAEKVYERRNRPFDDVEKGILQEVFDRTAKYRHF